MHHAAKCTPELWREGFQQRGSSEKAGCSCMESFDRLCEVINKTADVTNRKSGEAERHFFQTPIEEAKNLKRSSRTVRHKGLLVSIPSDKRVYSTRS